MTIACDNTIHLRLHCLYLFHLNRPYKGPLATPTALTQELRDAIKDFPDDRLEALAHDTIDRCTQTIRFDDVEAVYEQELAFLLNERKEAQHPSTR